MQESCARRTRYPYDPVSMNVTYRQVVALAVPVMLANISVPLVGIVDTAVMGRYASPDYINAVAIASVLFSSIFWAFGFLRMGTGGLVAQAFGKADSDQIALTTARSLSLATVIGLLIILGGVLWFKAGMHFMAADARLSGLVFAYYRIRLFAAPITLSLYVVFGTLIGLQKMRSLLLLQLLLNLCNIALNILLYKLTDWHVRGVATATVISECLTLAFGLWLIRDHLLPIFYRWRELRDKFKQPAAFQRLWQISRDLFIRTTCLTLAFYSLTALSSQQGAYVLATNTILIHLLHLMAHWLDGFAHAAESLVGYAYGRRDKAGFKQAVRRCTHAAALLALLLTLFYAFFGVELVRLISHDPEVHRHADKYLWWIIIAPLIGVWGFMLDGIFIGITYTRAMRNGMLIALACFILSAYLLIPLMGNHGLWLAYCVLMIARAATLALSYRRIEF